MTPKFIYFDLDDTLLDHRGAEKAALKDLHQHFAWFNGTNLHALIDTYHQINKGLWEQYGRGEIDRQTLQRLRFENTLASLGLDERLYEEAGNFYMNAYRNHWSWIDGADRAFEKVSSHYQTGILTNGFAETQQMKIDQFALKDHVKYLVISEEVGFLKPQPEIFRHATALTGNSPDEILYIGDSYSSDILGGSSFGWKTAWFAMSGDKEQREKAEFVFSDFKDLCHLLNV